jgi:chromosome partitioning protein
VAKAKRRHISIVNNRGGVGKSTTAVNLAVGLAQKDFRVLLIDADPPGGATQAMGLVEEASVDKDFYTTADLMAGKSFAPFRDLLGMPGLDFLPATHRLGFLEPKLYAEGAAGTRRLSEAVEKVAKPYDYVLIDSPPHLGVLMTNVVIAAPEVLIPVKMDLGSVPQTLALFDYLKDLRTTLQPALKIVGVLPTFYEERAVTPRELHGQLKELFRERLFNTVIHQSRAVADAFGVGRPIVLANPNNRGATEYSRLTEEIVRRD